MSRSPRPRRSVLLGALTALAFLIPTGTAQAAAPEPAPGKVDTGLFAKLKTGRTSFLVALKEGADLSAAAKVTGKADKAAEVFRAKTAYAETSQKGLRALLTSRKAEFTPFWIANAVKVVGDADLAAEIAKLPEVQRIEPDGVVPVPEPPKSGGTAAKGTKGTKGVTKPKAAGAVEWNVDRVGAPKVWQEFGTRGEGIVVANVDTGVQYDHPALAAQYRGKKADGTVDHNYNWYDYSGLCPGGTPCDLNGHGTHSMGTMVGESVGVAPGATWISVNACLGGCSHSSLLSAGQWLLAPTDLKGQNPRPDLAPHVVNNSWTVTEINAWYKPVIDTWTAAGIFPVFASGNANATCNTAGSPGADVDAYSVGAFDINNAIANFSKRGAGEKGEIKPNIAAPGVDIRSALPGNGYGLKSGTSMASPHVAATVALLWAAAPALKRDVAATRELLDRTAVDVDDRSCGGTAAKNNVWGEGRLDAHRALTDAPTGRVGGLSGTVTSGTSGTSGGSPVAQVALTVAGPLNRKLVTGKDGTYSLPHLKVGTYRVTARGLGYGEATATVTVSDGRTARHDIALTALPTHPVSGTVTIDGGPEAGVTIGVAGTETTVVTDAAGRYSLPMPAGDHTLEATPPRTRCAGATAETVTVNAATTKDIAMPRRTDAFGYSCVVGKEPYVPGTRKVDFTQVPVPSVALPFPVMHYGKTYTGVRVSRGGWLSFLDDWGSQENRQVPMYSPTNAAIYPFWDDIAVEGASGVYTATVGTAPRRSFVVEWRDVTFVQDRSVKISFAAVLGEDGSIGFRYRGVSGVLSSGDSATIGIEDHGGLDGFQYSYNRPSLTDGQSITFTAGRHGVLAGTVTDTNDGRPLAGATVKIGDGETSTTAEDGTFVAQVPVGDHQVTVSKEHYGPVTQPVTVAAGTRTAMDASLITGRVSASVSELDLVMPAESSRTDTVILTNLGGSATSYTLALEPAQSWLSATPATGDIAPGASVTVTVTARSTGTGPGIVRAGKLLVRSASGRDPQIAIPVTMVVPKLRIALDAGGTREVVDSTGEQWAADRAYTAGGHGYAGTRTRVSTTGRTIKGTADQELFRRGRESMSEYRFDNLPQGVYTVELGFAETRNMRPERRVVDVYVEDELAVPALDLAQEVGVRAATIRQYTVKVIDGQLNVTFLARSGSPLVNSIRVSERPDKAAP
ncbi:Carboxypeptidase regulatory-like domain-containing protein [Sinosporangium album]|uniref:alpha-amylase n=1 Tax=Sinosporangium album TaxID=504805 RepID=A0A1G7W0P3_9ACTN|nr:S8 family serine peptidase [Sinosporangium album]SDG65503.1 Carboxypeptidase regulatory-like domain-containing protein [Sinosporangium album]